MIGHNIDESDEGQHTSLPLLLALAMLKKEYSDTAKSEILMGRFH
jgi:hypothetical protein